MRVSFMQRKITEQLIRSIKELNIDFKKWEAEVVGRYERHPIYELLACKRWNQITNWNQNYSKSKKLIVQVNEGAEEIEESDLGYLGSTLCQFVFIHQDGRYVLPVVNPKLFRTCNEKWIQEENKMNEVAIHNPRYTYQSFINDMAIATQGNWIYLPEPYLLVKNKLQPPDAVFLVENGLYVENNKGLMIVNEVKSCWKRDEHFEPAKDTKESIEKYDLIPREFITNGFIMSFFCADTLVSSNDWDTMPNHDSYDSVVPIPVYIKILSVSTILERKIPYLCNIIEEVQKKVEWFSINPFIMQFVWPTEEGFRRLYVVQDPTQDHRELLWKIYNEY